MAPLDDYFCPRCEKWKDEDEFSVSRTGKRQGWCRGCYAAYNATYYQDRLTPEQRTQREQRKQAAALRRWPWVIYGLRDPRTGEILYVGQSGVGMKRPLSHRSESRARDATRKGRWLASLDEHGLKVDVVVLERVSSRDGLDEAEQRWIAIGRQALGERLLNDTAGGRSGSPSESVRRRHQAIMSDDRMRKRISETKLAAASVETILRQIHRRLMTRARRAVAEMRPHCVEYRTIRVQQDLADRISTALLQRPYRTQQSIADALGCSVSAVSAINIARRVRPRRACV